MNRLVIQIDVDGEAKASTVLRVLDADIKKTAASSNQAGQAGGSALTPLIRGAGTALGAITGLSVGIVGVTLALTSATHAAVNFGQETLQALREAEPAVVTLGNAARAYNGQLLTALNSAEKLREELGATREGAQEIVAFAQQFAAIAQKTNEVDRFTKALGDLAAARGRRSSEIPQIIQSALAGEDQALNRLGLANLGQLYEAYARSIGKTAASSPSTISRTRRSAARPRRASALTLWTPRARRSAESSSPSTNPARTADACRPSTLAMCPEARRSGLAGENSRGSTTRLKSYR
jgi:hypothetical protein